MRIKKAICSFILGVFVALGIYLVINGCNLKQINPNTNKSTSNVERIKKELIVRNQKVQRIDTISSIPYKKDGNVGYHVQQEEVYTPKNGIVPNAKTAVQIAIPVMESYYGKEVFKKMPIAVTLRHNTWLLKGHVKLNKIGGGYYVEIDKASGRFLTIILEK